MGLANKILLPIANLFNLILIFFKTIIPNIQTKRGEDTLWPLKDQLHQLESNNQLAMMLS